MGSVYLVSTPIGNRDDISLRALKTLFSVDLILAEDTRQADKLLNLYSADLLEAVGVTSQKPKLTSFYEENEERKINLVIDRLVAGDDVALISNAGTPLISDPGFKLVRECLKQGIEVIAVPGASALLSALVVSGLPPDKFLFLGFLPKKEGKKRQLLEKAIQIKSSFSATIVAYESPFRLVKTLNLLSELSPDREVVLLKELTKKFETRFQGTATELATKLGKMVKIKGEWVLLL